MDLQEVKQFLKENAEKDDVKAYLSELSKVSSEQESEIIESYKKSTEFRREIDRENTKAIKTYTEKTVPGLIETAVTEKEKELLDKYDKPKDPKELKWERDFKKMQEDLEERDKKVAERDRKLIQKEIKNTIHSLLGEKQIPIKYANLVPVDYSKFTIDDIEDEENLKEMLMPNVETLAAFSAESRQAQAEEMHRRGAITPQRSALSNPEQQLTLEQYNALSKEEKAIAYKEGKVNQILGRQ